MQNQGGPKPPPCRSKETLSFFVWLGAKYFCKGGLGSLALPPLQKCKQHRQTNKLSISPSV